MDSKYTEADFEQLSWHDCYIWGLDFRVGDPDENDWTSDLVLDIDFSAALVILRTKSADGAMKEHRVPRR